MAPEVKIYSTDTCGWCDRAKKLLTEMGYPYKEYTVGGDLTREDFLDIVDTLGAPRTVPQIFFDDDHVGGYTHLVEKLVRERV